MFKRNQKRSTQGAGAKLSIDVAAHADVVWKILIDVESNERLHRNCAGVKNLNPKRSLNPVEPGAKYHDKRIFQGTAYEFVNHVTEVDHTRRRFSEATSVNHCTCTSTIWIDELENGGCRLFGSAGMIPDGLLGKFYFWRKGHTMEADGYAAMMMDLEDIKHMAEHGTFKTNDSEPITESSSSNATDLLGSRRSA